MTAEIVNLRKARKARDRVAKEKRAEENRAKFGRTKAERKEAEANNDLSLRRLDAHKRPTDPAAKTDADDVGPDDGEEPGS
jgi:hypothetical protein